MKMAAGDPVVLLDGRPGVTLPYTGRPRVTLSEGGRPEATLSFFWTAVRG